MMAMGCRCGPVWHLNLDLWYASNKALSASSSEISPPVGAQSIVRRLPVPTRLQIGARRITAVLFALFALTACDQPWWYLDKIKIEASFRPDGSCSFSVDGKTLSDSRYKQINELNRGSGITSENFDGYWIQCDFPGAMIPPLPTLMVLMVVPKGNVPSRGNYEVSEEDGMSTHVETTIGVLWYEKYSRQGFANGITGAQLMATKGTFVIDKVTQKSLLIDGHLSVIARRRALGL